MQRMTDALSRMLNDPSTRLAMRTLGDRENAATRNYQRSQSEQQIDEDDELQSNTNTPPEVVAPEINRSSVEHDNQTHDDEVGEKAQPTSLTTDESMSENAKCVPDITIESCSQNVVTDDEDLEPSSHKDQNEKIKNGVEKQGDNDPCVFTSSSLDNSLEKQEDSGTTYGTSIG